MVNPGIAVGLHALIAAASLGVLAFGERFSMQPVFVAIALNVACAVVLATFYLVPAPQQNRAGGGMDTDYDGPTVIQLSDD